ncbi:MAG: GNAT family N-acetyltransferase [Anaerolineales bacterium]
MPYTFSSPHVVCRPAIARDHADVTEFCKRIWNGHDYVPNTWHDWFLHPNGLFATAEYEGHAIACSKITLLAEGQWWLEGFRVDPSHQGKKVGSQIHNYLMDWWQEHGDGTLRLMTSSKNKHVHHLSEKTGYVKTYECCGYKSSPLNEPVKTISPVTDIEEAVEFAHASESLQLTGGRVDLGWRTAILNKSIIRGFSDERSDYVHTFHWWRDKQGLFSTWEDGDDDARSLYIGALACRLEDMPSLLMDIRRLAAQKNCHELFQITFDLPQLVSGLKAAGFTQFWEHNTFIFETKHPTRP